MSSGLLGQVEAGMEGLKASEKPPSGTVNDLQSVTDGAIVNGLAAHVEAFKHSSLGQPVNDRKYTLEELISEASAAPSGSEVRLQLADTIMSRLWDDLKHPPTSFLGKQFMYRAANGSGNVSSLRDRQSSTIRTRWLIHPQNIQFPHVGAAGSNYARAVSAKTVRTADLPDPREVFDRILLRKDFKPHPNGISSFLLHLGLIVIQGRHLFLHVEVPRDKYG